MSEYPSKQFYRWLKITFIALEKEAMAYFLGLKALVPARMGKDIVDTIIKEEMGHIGVLNKELTSLK